MENVMRKQIKGCSVVAAVMVATTLLAGEEGVVVNAPFGKLALVEEIDLTGAGVEAGITPAGATEVKDILGRPARTLKVVPKESVSLTVRVGKGKGLKPGAAYVLSLEYPEDAPRSMIVMNGANEANIGFHTGVALGDAMKPKYVNNLVESLDLPLSGKWETWASLFRLHERFAPDGGLQNGFDTPRSLKPEDGFNVDILAFAEGNDPLSQGPAFGKLRLYEVMDEGALALKIQFPPEGLPRRRVFWREEMSDGVIEGKAETRGFDDPLEWYRHKAEFMRFLGVNTYTKDLLEFGHNQHWDSSPGGGNEWVNMDWELRGLWERIVGLMGGYGFDILPYYEYGGSRGQNGLGNKRRAKPLTRDDAYTHVHWVESANVDITDPDAVADFKKMLDHTVIRFKDKANFAGAWLRSRNQIPVSFGEEALARFGAEANKGEAPTRAQLIADKALYERYIAWWNLKRRAFFEAQRDHLRANGIKDAVVLYTGELGEPGVGFGDWHPRFVADRPDLWKPVFAASERPPDILTPKAVAESGLYHKGLLATGLNWGDWENHHARPSDDPANYRNTEGVMLTHAFNRLYTVMSPATMDLYRAPSGLAMVRHFTLNEHMAYDKDDKPKLGYFVADIERAGPYCMLAEAVAMANGDPTMLGYLVGANHARGFPQFVRDFNANFLALPALPSKVVVGASADGDVVARVIDAGAKGKWVFAVNTSPQPKTDAVINFGGEGVLKPLSESAGKGAVKSASVKINLHPYQLVSFKVQ